MNSAVESIAYGYDQLDRLTLACAWNVSTNSCVSGQFNQSFRYDKLGNILTKAGTNYTYGSSKPHAVTAAGANSYTYDNNGNMLTGAGRTFTWNGENQPVQIAKTGTPTETYIYDGDNVRIKRTVASSPAVTSIYVGKVEYRGTQVISTYGGVASRTTTGTPTSSNLGTIVYMHTDHLGSVRMTTSATGTVAQTQEFDPWGAVKAGGITSVSYNYTGQRLDGTGLLFYNARYYDPQLARFTSADSLVSNDADPQTRNRYAYVLNNPLKYNDPTGHVAEPIEIFTNNSYIQEWSAKVFEEILARASLASYGILLVDTLDASWTLDEMKLVLQAIKDILSATGWSTATFNELMGNTIIYRGGDMGYVGGATITEREIIMFDGAHYDNLFKEILVHEFAHIWDRRSNRNLSKGIANATGSKQGSCTSGDCYEEKGETASDYARINMREDWAESFSAFVYRDASPVSWDNMSQERKDFVRRSVKNN